MSARATVLGDLAAAAFERAKELRRNTDPEALYREALVIYTPISPPDADRIQERLHALSS